MMVPRGTRFEVELPGGAAIVGPVSANMKYVSNENKAKVHPFPRLTIVGFDFRLVYLEGLTIERFGMRSRPR